MGLRVLISESWYKAQRERDGTRLGANGMEQEKGGAVAGTALSCNSGSSATPSDGNGFAVPAARRGESSDFVRQPKPPA
jgi:hypothetical protein